MESFERVKITSRNVLFVPQLSTRLFLLMSLIEQGHDVHLSKSQGVQIYFSTITSPVTLPMPNYHLFASSALSTRNNPIKLTTIKKQETDLDLLYWCLGCRSIKTLLSANRENLWEDSNIIVRNDLISTSDHHIATICKKNRIKHSTPDSSIKPGQILCLDIVKNPAKCSGLTQDTTFRYYSLLVNKFS